MNLCIFITEGTRMTCLERQYLSFIIPQISLQKTLNAKIV